MADLKPDFYPRYRESLSSFPAPGSGCHTHIMTVVNYGLMAGVSPEGLFNDIRRAIPPGSRRVPDSEISKTIQNALSQNSKGTFTPTPKAKPVVADGKAVLRKLIAKSTIDTEEALRKSSPASLPIHPVGGVTLLLINLYELDDLLFIADKYDAGVIGENIRTMEEWVRFFLAGGKIPPFIMINPLDGIPRPKESGDGETLRGNSNVKTFRYCLLEFDTLSIEDQIRFWSVADLPLAALIHTGNKSIHAWVDLQDAVKSREDWQETVKNHLYDRLLAPFGIDKACANPARLARFPGYFREENKQFQRIVWFKRGER